MDLSKVRPGQYATVKRINLKGILRRRLMDMGVLVGEILQVDRIAPLGDPIKIKVKNYQLSLRKSEAEGIEVEIKSDKKEV